MKIVVTGRVELALAGEDNWTADMTADIRGRWTEAFKGVVLDALSEVAHADTRVAIYDVKAEVIAPKP